MTAEERYQRGLETKDESQCSCPLDEDTWGEDGWHHRVTTLDHCFLYPIGPRGIQRLSVLQGIGGHLPGSAYENG